MSTEAMVAIGVLISVGISAFFTLTQFWIHNLDKSAHIKRRRFW